MAIAPAWAAKTLDIYFVDVEGGQATLLVTPAGESLLIDTGWPGFDNRDANRIAAAAQKAGVNRIDWLIVTHFHRDHVGGLRQLADKLAIHNLVDHGRTVETSPQAAELYAMYEAVAGKGKRHTVKPGDKLPIKGLQVEVLAAHGQTTTRAGNKNPLCAAAEKKAPDPTDNAQSVGVLVSYGKFRFLDLGDLTWNKELELACPENRIGTVDLYLTTHHGTETSGPAALVHAIRPRVAIMNNGERKGGSPQAWQIVRSTPGLKDLWQLHYSQAGGKENNTAETMIANLYGTDEGHYLVVRAQSNGRFQVMNSRNGFSKTY